MDKTMWLCAVLFCSHVHAREQENFSAYQQGVRPSSVELVRQSLYTERGEGSSWVTKDTSCGRYDAIFTLRSEHFEARRYNQDNVGVGLSYRDCSWKDGRYIMATYVRRNSLGGQTFVIGFGYELLATTLAGYRISFGQELNAIDYHIPQKCGTRRGITGCLPPSSRQGFLPMQVLRIGKNETSFSIRQLVPDKPILLFAVETRLW